MGLPSSQASSYNGVWESGTGKIMMDDVNCEGDEANLEECRWVASHNCGHSEDVGVICDGEHETIVRPMVIEVGNSRLIVNPNTVTEYRDEA